MTEKESLLKVDGEAVLVQRKSIKNMYLRVDPGGGIRVSAPQRTSDAVIADFVRRRRDWIGKARQRAAVKAAKPSRTFSAADRRAFRAKCEAALQKWQPAAGRKASGFSVRDMTSRWGSCNTRTGHLNFNLKLLDMPPECLDYVVCHELCHLWVAGHGPRFWARMDRIYPDWRRVRKMLRQ